jgi:hypothetical protein
MKTWQPLSARRLTSKVIRALIAAVEEGRRCQVHPVLRFRGIIRLAPERVVVTDPPGPMPDGIEARLRMPLPLERNLDRVFDRGRKRLDRLVRERGFSIQLDRGVS